MMGSGISVLLFRRYQNIGLCGVLHESGEAPPLSGRTSTCCILRVFCVENRASIYRKTGRKCQVGPDTDVIEKKVRGEVAKKRLKWRSRGKLLRSSGWSSDRPYKSEAPELSSE